MDASADAAARGGKFGTPLGAAGQGIYSDNAGPELTMLLLDNLEKIEREVTVGRLLRWGSVKGHIELVARILEKLEPLPSDDFLWCGIIPFGYCSYMHNCSPAYDAAIAGKADVLRLFINSWKHVDERDYEGRTALYWAVFRGREDVVRVLLDAGADPEPEPIASYGWTPSYWAIEKEYDTIISILDQAKTAGNR